MEYFEFLKILLCDYGAFILLVILLFSWIYAVVSVCQMCKYGYTDRVKFLEDRRNGNVHRQL